MNATEYTEHPIHSTVAQVLGLQSDEEFLQGVPALSEDQAWQLARVFEVVRVVERNLANTPATLTSTSALKNINNHLQQVFSELSNFRSNKNGAHVTNAESQVDAVISHLSGFAGRPGRSQEEGLGQIISDTRELAHGAMAALRREKEGLATQVSELSALVKAQATKLEELTAAVETQKKEALAVTTEVKTAYTKTEGELKTAFESELAAMKSDFGALKKETADSASTTLTTLKAKEEEVKRIVKVVGDRGITGNYQSTANAEARSANIMRGITIAFFIAGVVIAGGVLVAHLFPGIFPAQLIPGGPWELALRLVTALAIAAPAFYTARESARHRTNSDRARQRELELASLGPFIELLPEADRQQIVKDMTDRYFGGQVEAHEAKSIIDPRDLVDITKSAIDGLIKKVGR